MARNRILELITNARNGISITDIVKTTGYDRKKVFEELKTLSEKKQVKFKVDGCKKMYSLDDKN